MSASRSIVFVLTFVVSAFAGCSPRPEPPARTPARSVPAAVHPDPPRWPNDFSKHLGRSITLEGTAADCKIGAVLLGDRQMIWIDGLSSWPDGFYLGEDRGKRVRGTGTVIQKSDLPVVRDRQGEPVAQGMSVGEGVDFEDAKKRFLLTGAR